MLHSVTDHQPPLSVAAPSCAAAATPPWMPPAPRRIDATDVYRRTRDRLPAHLMERDQAQAEVASTQLLQGMRTGRRRMPG